MKKNIPKTRRHLQKIQREIQRTERWVGPVVMVSGTGVRGAAKEAEFRAKKNSRLRALRKEEALVKAGLLKKYEQDGQIAYKLTKDGEIQALKDKIWLTKRTCEADWICAVIFDIPLERKATRDMFRRFIKDCGFKQLQQSIWMTKKDVSLDLQELIDLLQLHKMIRVLEAKLVQTKHATGVP